MTRLDVSRAGDAFRATFWLALRDGKAVVDAARVAPAAASLKAKRSGGRLGGLKRTGVEARMARVCRPGSPTADR